MMEAEKIQSGKAQSLQITERHGEDMNIIVTVDENWAIGKGGDFLTRIPAEQRNTDSLTLGKTIIMGRKTLQALPQGQPLYVRDGCPFRGRTGRAAGGKRAGKHFCIWRRKRI